MKSKYEGILKKYLQSGLALKEYCKFNNLNLQGVVQLKKRSFMDEKMKKSNMIIYTPEDGLTKIETTFDTDTVWLFIDQMSELFQRDNPRFLDTSRISLQKVNCNAIQLLQILQQLLPMVKLIRWIITI